MNPPEIRVNLSDMNSVKSTQELEVIPIRLDRVMLNPNEGAVAVAVSTDGKNVGFALPSSEGTMLSFIHTGLSDSAHVQTLAQLFVRYMSEKGDSIESVTLESQVGDVIYASVRMMDSKGRAFWALVSVGDGLILSGLTQCALGAVKKVWDNLDEFDDWPYEESIIDYDEE